MDLDKNSSVIGRLLESVSWQGTAVRRMRNGGRGIEDVLTAEVFQALDLLPRAHFLAAVIESCDGDAAHARALLADEAEALRVEVFPDHFYLNPSRETHQEKLAVDPDAVIEATECLCFVEAKRIKSGATFMHEQLAREYFMLTREAGQRASCLLLVLGASPPVKVQGISGRLHPAEAIRRTLPAVYDRAEPHPQSLEELLEAVDDRLLWTTWSEVGEVVARTSKSITTGDKSIDASLGRLAASVSRAVAWHS